MRERSATSARRAAPGTTLAEVSDMNTQIIEEFRANEGGSADRSRAHP